MQKIYIKFVVVRRKGILCNFLIANDKDIKKSFPQLFCRLFSYLTLVRLEF